MDTPGAKELLGMIKRLETLAKERIALAESLMESLLRDLTDRDICPRCGEPINDDMGHMCPPDRR